MAKEPLSWLQETGGWAGLNQEGPTPDEAHKDTKALLVEYDTARMFFEVFSTGRGPELIEHLRGLLFETPIYSTNAIAFNDLQIPLTPDQWCWVRVGQNSVLFHIRAMLVKAMQGPPDVKPEEQQQ